jgi:hypothetical protein
MSDLPYPTSTVGTPGPQAVAGVAHIIAWELVVAAILPPMRTVGLPTVIRPTWLVGLANGGSTMPAWGGAL